MSEPANPNPSQTKRSLGCVFKIAITFVVLFFAFIFMAAGIGSGQMNALIALAFGWANFLNRTVTQISWNWDLVGMAILCVVIILLMGHYFASWVTNSIVSKRGKEWRWPWKWTCCGLAIVGIAFLVGMSVGGAAHQVGWLSSQSESWYERKGEDFLEIRQLDYGLQMALIDVGDDPAKLRQVLRDSKSEYIYRRSGEVAIIDKFHVLLIIGDTNNVTGTIIFSRDPLKRVRMGGRYSFGDTNDYFEAEKLPGLIQKHQGHLLAL